MKGLKIASRISYLVAGILSIVLAATFVALGIMFLVFALPGFKDTIVQGIEEGWIHIGGMGTGDMETDIAIVQGIFLGTAISMFIVTAFTVVNIIVSFKARKNPTKKLHIVNIVFGVLSGVIVNMVAGVFGLIIGSKEESK